MNQDLKARVPAGILYVLVIAGATLYGPISTTILLLIFFGLSLSEFTSASVGSQSSKSIYINGTAIVLTTLSLTSFIAEQNITAIIIIVCLALMANIFYLIHSKKSMASSKWTLLVAMVWLCLPFLISIILVQQSKVFPLVILGTFIIVWLNDAGAYFTGKAFGKNKLFPSVSPSKTWEGLIGGGICGILISIAIYNLVGALPLSSWIILSIIIWVIGSYGDLVESSWKRQLGLKDSGTLMKGHGGFLDRLDSFVYAIPFVSLYYVLWHSAN